MVLDSFPQGFEKGYLRSYVDRGYIIVMQDVRGRYMSEGDFDACPARGHAARRDETTDSYDTVDWLVRHIPHNNGRVGFAGMFLSGVLRHDGRSLRPSCREGRFAAGSRHRLVHGRRRAPQRRADAHRLLPFPERHEHPSADMLRPQKMPSDVAADPRPTSGRSSWSIRRWRNLPELLKPNPFWEEMCRTSRLRRVVAGARPAPGLLQRPACGAGRRRDVRRRGLLRGVEPLPGPEQAEPRDAVPSGRGPVGARGMAQRRPDARGVRFRRAMPRGNTTWSISRCRSSTTTSVTAIRTKRLRCRPPRSFSSGDNRWHTFGRWTAARGPETDLVPRRRRHASIPGARRPKTSATYLCVRSCRPRAVLSKPPACAAPKSIWSPTSVSCVGPSRRADVRYRAPRRGYDPSRPGRCRRWK